jgi:hypothetical protein
LPSTPSPKGSLWPAFGSTGYSSITPFWLPADGQWHHATFLLESTSPTAIGAAQPLNTLLSKVAEFRILNSPTPALNGTDVNAPVGVDNISALVIPEPGSFDLFLLGGAGACTWLRRGRARRSLHKSVNGNSPFEGVSTFANNDHRRLICPPFPDSQWSVAFALPATASLWQE